jgi:hypothetical protein
MMYGGTIVPRAWKAFFLGVLSFFLFFIVGELFMSVGEAMGLVAALILMAGYFFICQFHLSRGNPDALSQDWPIRLALDAIPLLLILIMLLAEKWPAILFQGLGILLSCCGGTFAGALAASRAARRTGLRR